MYISFHQDWYCLDFQLTHWFSGSSNWLDWYFYFTCSNWLDTSSVEAWHFIDFALAQIDLILQICLKLGTVLIFHLLSTWLDTSNLFQVDIALIDHLLLLDTENLIPNLILGRVWPFLNLLQAWYLQTFLGLTSLCIPLASSSSQVNLKSKRGCEGEDQGW